jgi:putative tryptophan/tyrosine transport system substrate-binding protein
MIRREFITLIGGAAAWPLAARAQQADRIRRIAVLSPLAEDDPEMTARLAGFRQGLAKRGWSEGRNVTAWTLALRPTAAQIRRRYRRKN